MVRSLLPSSQAKILGPQQHFGRSLLFASLLIGTAFAQQHTDMDTTSNGRKDCSARTRLCIRRTRWYCLIWSVCLLGLSLTRQFARSESPRSPLSPPRSSAILTNESCNSSSLDSLLHRQQQHHDQHAESVLACRSCGLSVDSIAISTPICPPPSPRTIHIRDSRSYSRSARLVSRVSESPQCRSNGCGCSSEGRCSHHHWRPGRRRQPQDQQSRSLLRCCQVRHCLGRGQPSLVSLWRSRTRGRRSLR